MADALFFSCLLLFLAAMQGTGAVDYAVNGNTSNSDGGVRFKKEIGAQNSLQTMADASNFIWNVFQQNNPSDRKTGPESNTVHRKRRQGSLANDNQIYVNANYLGTYKGDLRREFNGVLYRKMTHICQWDGNGQTSVWLNEEIADFVRLKANYIPSHWVQPGQGDRWDQRSDVTARFLEYYDGLRNGFVAELNKKMKSGHNAGYFVELDYKAKYGN
ncbi:hypothetical protein ES332_A13G049000v1 [Gossypium tomentosum]|uniref:GH16 domain-containing protein n=1 Tax=Gossypium tomentosum TaxID=34277 RepID=A0A5D2MGU5_GOSTO|nr:hypothetical protein ES332_A13G049000v1 [Gossypium tomentosum]